MAQPIVVCRKCKNSACLVEILERRGDADVDLVRCQKICHGPVVALAVDGTMQWFERVDDVRSLAALLKVTRKPNRRGKLPKALRKHRVKRYAGRLPRR